MQGREIMLPRTITLSDGLSSICGTNSSGFWRNPGNACGIIARQDILYRHNRRFIRMELE